MRTNVVLLAIAAALVAMVLYRTGAVQLNRKFWVDVVPLIAATMVMVGFSYYAGGNELIGNGLGKTWEKGFGLVPLLVPMFFAMGFGTALVEYNLDAVNAFIGGKYGFGGSLFAGMLTPGGLTGLPVVRDLWADASIRPQLLVFLISTRLLSWQILLITAAIVGWRIMLVQYAWSVGFALLVMGFFWVWSLSFAARA